MYVLHRSLKKANIAAPFGEELAQDRAQWREAIREGVKAAENKFAEATEERHRKRHIRGLPPCMSLQVSSVKHVANNAYQGSASISTPRHT